ncbi:MAG TPA: sigma-70 family RNA polymerase sigma factor [Polyangiaceae bacterium]|nr:sigma-70 family RNA polymerase sigma factor [Polyangiaceae bacterium]
MEIPSFQDLYAEYFGFVWSSARRLGVKPAAMDDVVQEIFMVIHRRMHTLRQPESLRSWIYSVVRRTVSGHRRRQRRHDAQDFALVRHTQAREDAQLTPQELTEQSEEAKLLWSLLAELDSTKREVLILVEIEGMSAPEVSEALQVPLNTVYSRLRTARLAFETVFGRRALREQSRGRA